MIRFSSANKTLSVFNFEIKTTSSLPYLAALTFLWIFMMALVNPVGEFPFSDDWMYSQSVFELVTNHRFVLNDFQAVTVLAQLLWGALFSIPFGFSMTALRMSVIVLGWMGVLGAYGLFREANAGRFLSFLGAVTFATTPFLVLFSNTFMTDVPFCATSVLSVLFFVRWIKNEKPADFLGAVFLASAAILIRPLALLIPLAFGFAYLVRRGISVKTLLLTLLALSAVAGTLTLYQDWLKATVGLPVMFIKKEMVFKTVLQFDGAMKYKLLAAFFKRLMVVLMYLGVFLFSLILLAAPAQWKRLVKGDRLILTAAAAVYALAVVRFLWELQMVMPLGMDQLFNLGLGCEQMDGNTLVAYKPFTGHAPFAFWLGITVIGLAGSSWLVAQAALFVKNFLMDAARGINPEKHWLSVFCLAIFSIHFFPFGLSGHFDRYQLFYIPFLAFWIIHLSGPAELPELRGRLPAFVILTALMAYFSVGATHDCLTRNRVRWSMLRYMMTVHQIPPEQIDGGYEFNGWYTYNKDYQKRPDMNWWWVIDDKYRVSYSPSAEGYNTIAKRDYDRWIPRGQGSIYILERIADKRPEYTGPARSVYEI